MLTIYFHVAIGVAPQRALRVLCSVSANTVLDNHAAGTM
jgi:hypothetical protein